MKQENFDLIQCAIMGIADYLRNTKLSVPKWMNKVEAKAYKTGFNRAKNMCRG